MSALTITVLTRTVAPLHPPGGMERAVYEQLVHLRALGLDLTVVTQPPSASTPLPPELAGIRWHFVRYGDLPLRRNSVPDRLLNYPLFVARVGRRLRAQPVLVGDLVHAHGLLAAAAPGRRPLVYAPHGLEEFSRADARKWLAYAPMRLTLLRAARRAAAVLATDESMRPAVAAALRVPPDRVRVIPNGVDVARLDALAAAGPDDAPGDDLDLAGAAPRLVTCARLERNKGLHVALTALATLQAELPAGWGWWIVGSGREQAALRRQAEGLGLGGRVHFLGRLADQALHRLLPRMDLYLMPSLYEGSSIATLEAMTHRLPVLATAVGGIPDKVLPGRTGYTCLPDDAAALAAALRRALGERRRWAELGAAGRALVLERFDWPRIAHQLADLYGELTETPRA